MIERIKFDKPTSLKHIKTRFKGNLTPRPGEFGKGTNAGAIRCPICYRTIGSLMVIKIDLNDLDNSLVLGWCDTACPCCWTDKTLDLSQLEIKNLVRNVIPQGISQYEYDKTILGLPEDKLREKAGHNKNYFKPI